MCLVSVSNVAVICPTAEEECITSVNRTQPTGHSQRSDKKPEAVLAYNEDKGGVNVVDKIIDTDRCKVATRGWPMVVFYTTIDIAALNTPVLWLLKNPRWHERKRGQRRRLSLHELDMA